MVMDEGLWVDCFGFFAIAVIRLERLMIPMKKGAQFLKRTMAIVLAALLLFTNAALVPVAAITGSESSVVNEPADDGKWHGTTGSLVAGNYQLNNYEIDILLCAGIAGDT